ncbi:MAG: hypothetical protein ACRC4M_04965 [Mycoplasma sp.]
MFSAIAGIIGPIFNSMLVYMIVAALVPFVLGFVYTFLTYMINSLFSLVIQFSSVNLFSLFSPGGVSNITIPWDSNTPLGQFYWSFIAILIFALIFAVIWESVRKLFTWNLIERNFTTSGDKATPGGILKTWLKWVGITFLTIFTLPLLILALQLFTNTIATYIISPLFGGFKNGVLPSLQDTQQAFNTLYLYATDINLLMTSFLGEKFNFITEMGENFGEIVIGNETIDLKALTSIELIKLLATGSMANKENMNAWIQLFSNEINQITRLSSNMKSDIYSSLTSSTGFDHNVIGTVSSHLRSIKVSLLNINSLISGSQDSMLFLSNDFLREGNLLTSLENVAKDKNQKETFVNTVMNGLYGQGTGYFNWMSEGAIIKDKNDNSQNAIDLVNAWLPGVTLSSISPFTNNLLQVDFINDQPIFYEEINGFKSFQMTMLNGLEQDAGMFNLGLKFIFSQIPNNVNQSIINVNSSIVPINDILNRMKDSLNVNSNDTFKASYFLLTASTFVNSTSGNPITLSVFAENIVQAGTLHLNTFDNLFAKGVSEMNINDSLSLTTSATVAHVSTFSNTKNTLPDGVYKEFPIITILHQNICPPVVFNLDQILAVTVALMVCIMTVKVLFSAFLFLVWRVLQIVTNFLFLIMNGILFAWKDDGKGNDEKSFFNILKEILGNIFIVIAIIFSLHLFTFLLNTFTDPKIVNNLFSDPFNGAQSNLGSWMSIKTHSSLYISTLLFSFNPAGLFKILFLLGVITVSLKIMKQTPNFLASKIGLKDPLEKGDELLEDLTKSFSFAFNIAKTTFMAGALIGNTLKGKKESEKLDNALKDIRTAKTPEAINNMTQKHSAFLNKHGISADDVKVNKNGKFKSGEKLNKKVEAAKAKFQSPANKNRASFKNSSSKLKGQLNEHGGAVFGMAAAATIGLSSATGKTYNKYKELKGNSDETKTRLKATGINPKSKYAKSLHSRLMQNPESFETINELPQGILSGTQPPTSEQQRMLEELNIADIVTKRRKTIVQEGTLESNYKGPIVYTEEFLTQETKRKAQIELNDVFRTLEENPTTKGLLFDAINSSKPEKRNAATISLMKNFQETGFNSPLFQQYQKNQDLINQADKLPENKETWKEDDYRKFEESELAKKNTFYLGDIIPDLINIKNGENTSNAITYDNLSEEEKINAQKLLEIKILEEKVSEAEGRLEVRTAKNTLKEKKKEFKKEVEEQAKKSSEQQETNQQQTNKKNPETTDKSDN